LSIEEREFKLAADSACIDAGTPIPNIAERFYGSAPDLGAYESKVGPPKLAKFKVIDASSVPRAAEIGREASPGEPAAGAFRETAGKVVIEAESFSENIPRDGAAWKIETSQPGFSGRGYLAAGPNSGSVWGSGSDDRLQLRDAPQCNYRIHLDSQGAYHVAVYMYGASSRDDSCHIGLDGKCTTGYRVYGSRQGQWHWADTTKEGRRVTLVVKTPGNHTLNLWVREDGVLVDKIMLSKNP